MQRQRAYVRGFTLVELAVVLAVAGVYVFLAMSYGNRARTTAQNIGSEFQIEIVNATLSFAQRNLRLPCADTDGDGFEGEAGSGCGTNDGSYVMGAVPFRTLELSLPTEATSTLERSFLYGVYRNASADADLTRILERTTDPNTSGRYSEQLDFIKALRSAASAPNATRLRVTGEGARMGPIDCATSFTNVAFVVVFAGPGDADGNGNVFDGTNSASSWPAGGSNCTASPAQGVSDTYDDVVSAVGFAELTGRLTQ